LVQSVSKRDWAKGLGDLLATVDCLVSGLTLRMPDRRP